MNRFRAAALALLLLPLCAPLLAGPKKSAYPNLSNFGAPPDTGAAWFQQCLRVQQRRPPARDLARTSPPGGAKTCDATNLYYDKLHQAAVSQGEWDKVRHCALAANETSVLMMLYANGFGVIQDADLAVMYACGGEGAPAEMEARVMHLARLQEIDRGDPFDQCDHITSGYMGGFCAAIAERQASKVRSAFLARIRKGLTAPQQAPFDALVNAAATFAASRGNDETDMTGTARGQMAINAEAGELEWLREHIAAFEKGEHRLPAAEKFESAEADLNRAYQRLMELPGTNENHPDRLEWSTIEKSGVRSTQLAWLAYRDAWVRFAAERYPEISAASLKTALTQRRNKQLARLAPG